MNPDPESLPRAGDARLRRSVLKGLVALGGASALSACLDLFEDRPEPPSGTDDPSELPDRQFAWNEHSRRDDHGNVALPTHQVFLYLSLDGDGPPGEDDRRTVDAALHSLERAYAWSHDGLLFSAGYTPAYFDRFDASLPEAIDLPAPRPLAPNENRDNVDFDAQDLLVHLASDRADVVLAAEGALRGERDALNGVSVEAALTDAMTVESRRTGFIGAGLPHEKAADGLSGVPDGNPIPEASPLFMGFKAGFAGNQASEDAVAIPDGPFADGTTKHVANIRQRLEDWYGEQDFDQRVMELFSPGHAAEGLVEGVGENLGDDSGVDRFVGDVEAHATEYGRVGHAQKCARRNRDADGNPLLLRRHVESTDDDEASLHFPSLQRGIGQFEAVREAMNGTDVTQMTPAVRPQVNNGILEYIFTRRRGNFLVPPRRHRALPTPRPE